MFTLHITQTRYLISLIQLFEVRFMINYSMISDAFPYPHEIPLVCVLKIYIVIQKHYNITFTLMFCTVCIYFLILCSHFIMICYECKWKYTCLWQRWSFTLFCTRYSLLTFQSSSANNTKKRFTQTKKKELLGFCDIFQVPCEFISARV